MADTKISGMAAATALTGAEVLPVVQSAANVKATTQQVVDAAMTTGLTRQALGSISTNTTIDWSAGSYVTATIGGALTFTFSNPAPTGNACVAYLQLTNGGSAVITWPVSVTWSGGTAPTLRASGVDLLRFYTQDNGTTWFGTAENDEANVAGSDTQVLFNDGGVLAGDSGFTFNKTNNTIDLGGATVTASDPVLDLSQTWNSAGVVFTGLNINITNTASSSGSFIQQWQVGGFRLVGITRDGQIRANGSSGISDQNGLSAITWPGGVLTIPSAYFSGTIYGPSNVIELRNGTNANTLRVNGTYTDASNYVRGALDATSTAVTLTAETAGTGADDVPIRLTPAGVAQVEIGNGVQFTEMTAPSAPAANKVVLFAQDNGAGKTQLMALFASGAAQQVAVEP